MAVFLLNMVFAYMCPFMFIYLNESVCIRADSVSMCICVCAFVGLYLCECV